VPSDLFGLAMPGDESPLKRAQEIGFGPLREMLGGRVAVRKQESENVIS
jgi:hypothetical protein